MENCEKHTHTQCSVCPFFSVMYFQFSAASKPQFKPKKNINGLHMIYFSASLIVFELNNIILTVFFRLTISCHIYSASNEGKKKYLKESLIVYLLSLLGYVRSSSSLICQVCPAIGPKPAFQSEFIATLFFQFFCPKPHGTP